MDEFYIMARSTQDERFNRMEFEKNSLEYKARIVYSHFKAWCFMKSRDCTVETMEDFLKTDSGFSFKVDSWLKKHISEKYFGYRYEYDREAGKWKATRE